MGTVIASTLVLPRYKIDDLIRVSSALNDCECVKPLFFRCIGCDASRWQAWYTLLRYAWDEFRTLNLDGL